MPGVGVQHDTLRFERTAVDILARFVAQDRVCHAVHEQQRLAQRLDLTRAVELRRQRRDGTDDRRQFARFDYNRGAEAVANSTTSLAPMPLRKEQPASTSSTHSSKLLGVR